MMARQYAPSRTTILACLLPIAVIGIGIAVCLAWGMLWGGAAANAYHLRLLPAFETAVARGPMSDEVLSGIAQAGTYDTARAHLQFLEEEGLSAYALRR